MKPTGKAFAFCVAAVIVIGLVAVTFDEASNTLVNRFIRGSISGAMEQYQMYPPEQTALVLIDAQNGFLTNEPDLTRTLAALVDFARRQRYRIVYTSYDAGAAHRFPTKAHDQIASRLDGSPAARAFPERLTPRDGDIVIPPRSSLSAFSGTGLDRRLKSSGLEHLILAGPLTLTTLDSTVRDAAQYDYHVTVLRDGAGAASSDATRAEFEYTFWRYAQSVLDLDALTSLVEDPANDPQPRRQ